ncbi:MAG: type II toxin-antitoxin system RelE/ParE family toxin [Pseudonocardia sp.]
MWEIEFSSEFEAWWRELTDDQQEILDQRLHLLGNQGPGLGRPAVDTLTGSKVANMKELRAGTIRVLFVFDPRRVAILLLGGDKRGQWTRWYLEAIPAAERLYTRHLKEIEPQEGR